MVLAATGWQAGLVFLRSALLWVLKVLMLLESYRTTLSLLLVSFYYFPTVTVAVASTCYFLVGFGLRLASVLLPRLLPLRQRVALAAWWNGREGKNRAVVQALAVLLVPGLTLYLTSGWDSKWRRGCLRWLSVLVAANLVSLDDFKTAFNAASDGARALWAGVAREWVKFCGVSGGVAPTTHDESLVHSSDVCLVGGGWVDGTQDKAKEFGVHRSPPPETSPPSAGAKSATDNGHKPGSKGGSGDEYGETRRRPGGAHEEESE